MCFVKFTVGKIIRYSVVSFTYKQRISSDLKFCLILHQINTAATFIDVRRSNENQ